MPRPTTAERASSSTSRPTPVIVIAVTSRCRCSASSRVVAIGGAALVRGRPRFPLDTSDGRGRIASVAIAVGRRCGQPEDSGAERAVGLAQAPSGVAERMDARERWRLCTRQTPRDRHSPNTGTTRVLLYRSDTGTIRVEIRVDPTVVDGFGLDPNGDPSSKSVVVHGQPGVLTIDPKANGLDTLDVGRRRAHARHHHGDRRR